MQTNILNRYRPQPGRRRITLLYTAVTLALAACSGTPPSPTDGFYARPYMDNNYGQPAGDPLNSSPADLTTRAARLMSARG